MEEHGRMGMATGTRIAQAHAHGVLRVQDYQRAKRFYQDTLGFEVRDTQGWSGGGWVIAGDGTGFEIYERPGMPAPQNTTLGFTVADFDAAYQDLKQRGVTFEEYDIPEMGLKTVNGVASMDAQKVAWFKDTEGNILAIETMTM